MNANKCIYTALQKHMSQTIDVLALEAASLLLNQGKGCGRSVKERKQLLSSCLGGTEKKKVKTWKMFRQFNDSKPNGLITHLQTSVHEVHLQLPSLLVLRDTSRTHYPVWTKEGGDYKKSRWLIISIGFIVTYSSEVTKVWDKCQMQV